MPALTRGGRPRRPTRRRRRNAGVTVLEATLGMAVFALAALGGLALMGNSMNLDLANRESAIATQAAREMMEELRSVRLDLAFAEFNQIASDDPGGAGTGRGHEFSVPELEYLETVTGNVAGEIVFPATSTGELLETEVIPALGMPRDLNGDDATDALDHAGDYLILPVTVRVRWTGARGESVVEMHTVLGRRSTP